MRTNSIFRCALSVILVAGLAGAPWAQRRRGRPITRGDLAKQPTEPTLGQGTLKIVGEGGERIRAPRIMPLKRTAVRAAVSGFVAEVEVTQVFTNPAEKPIEAVYVFPLPENAAVDRMTLRVAGRVIRGRIKKRKEAKAVYERAKAAGKTAALLDQERPNIFTQSVANIPPGKEIKVTLRYVQDLPYDASVYKFVFPMVVGPRFSPGKKTPAGWAPDAGRVPDAGRISPPMLPPGKRSGHDISISVSIDAGVPITEVRSKSHDIGVKRKGKSRAEVSLDPADRIPNKDFILTYRPSGKAVEAAVLAHKDGAEGYLTLMLQPKADFPLSKITPKELVFAIDVSGSMSGFPMETAKKLVNRCLGGMNPGDTFQILAFASGNRLLFDKPLSSTPENIRRARGELGRLRGGGGTNMLEAIGKALEFPKDPERLRIVLFMTDGYIGNEREVLSFIRTHLNNSRVFPLGVGSSPNRYLLEEMAVMGRGSVQYVRQFERTSKLEKIIERFYDRIAKPYLTDLSVDWAGLDVLDATPGLMPDLFAGQPVFVHGRYREPGEATVHLIGKLAGKPWKMPVRVKLPKKLKAHRVMGPLWARARIKDLERTMYRDKSKETVEKITALALRHELMSKYTSFVAVDETPSVAKGVKPMVVPVAVPIPAGTKREGFLGGGFAGGGYSSGGAFGGTGMLPAMAPRRVRAMRRRAPHPVPAYEGIAALESDRPGVVRVRRKKRGGSSPSGAGYAGAAALQSDGVGTARVRKPKGRRSRVESLARKLLVSPGMRAARRLISLQEASGAFKEPGGGEASVRVQAWAVLALAKARRDLGPDIGPALRRAWARLKSVSGTADAEAAIRKALSGSPRWALARKELAALRPELKRLN